MTDVTSPGSAILAAVIAKLRTSARVLAAHEGGRPVSAYQVSPTRAPGLEDSTGYPLIEVPSVQEIGGERLGGDDEDDIEEGDEDDNADASGCVFDPTEVFVDVHVFSRIRGDVGGMPEAMNIAAACRRTLGRRLAVEGGFKVTLGEWTGSRHFTDPDGVTAHTIDTFRYLIHPSED